MSDFEIYECAQCGDGFVAYRDAHATDGPYCSPVCESEGKSYT